MSDNKVFTPNFDGKPEGMQPVVKHRMIYDESDMMFNPMFQDIMKMIDASVEIGRLGNAEAEAITVNCEENIVLGYPVTLEQVEAEIVEMEDKDE